jgi:hypothetical protein
MLFGLSIGRRDTAGTLGMSPVVGEFARTGWLIRRSAS